MRWTEDVAASLARLDGSRAALRRFGLTVGAVLLALAGWLLFRDRSFWLWAAPAAAGLGLLAAAAAFPAALRHPRRAWMAVAFALGWVMSRVALTALFLLVVTPLGLAARLTGKRFLGSGADPGAASYWVRRPSGRSDRYDKMY